MNNGHQATEQVDIPVPYDVSIEEAVIGSLLIDREAIIEVNEYLEPEDFYVEVLGKIYGIITDLYLEGAPADARLIVAREGDLGIEDELGGFARLASCATRTPTSSHVIYYAKKVRTYAEHRRLISAGGAIAALGYERNDTEIVDKAQEILSKVQRSLPTEWASVGSILPLYMEEVEHGDKAVGIPTGFSMLDDAIGGMRGGDVIVVAARAGAGKTSFATSVAYNTASMGNGVGFIEMEMRKEQLVNRLLSRATDLDSQQISRGVLDSEERDRLRYGAEQIKSLPIHIADDAGVTLRSIRSRIFRLMGSEEISVVMIDYLQLIQPEATKSTFVNRVQEIANISRGLKLLAREIDLPIMALCQLNRESEKRKSHEPLLSDLREGGSIEQDADIVLGIYREELYEADSYKVGIAEIIALKTRNSGATRVPLLWHPTTASFRDMAYLPDTWRVI